MKRLQFRIVKDIVLKRKISFIVSIIMMTTAFITMGYSLINYSVSADYEKRVQTGLSTDVSQVGELSIEWKNSDEEEINEYELLADEINSIDGLQGVGEYQMDYMYIPDGLMKLKDIQKGNVRKIEGDDVLSEDEMKNFIQVSMMYDKDLWNAFSFKLTKGYEPSEYEEKDEIETILLYVSEKYSDVVNVGEEYIEASSDEFKTRYIIGGILSDESKILDENIRFNNSAAIGYFDIDYDIVGVCISGEALEGMFYCKNGEYENVVNKMEEIGSKYGVTINTINILGKLEKQLKESKEILDTMIEITILLVLSAFVIIICGQSIIILTLSRNFGIWLSNGATKRDLIVSFILQNVLRMIISLILGVVALYFVQKSECQGVCVEQWKMVVNIFKYNAVPKMALVGVLAVVCLSAIPAWIFRKSSVINMIKGEV